VLAAADAAPEEELELPDKLLLFILLPFKLLLLLLLPPLFQPLPPM